MSAARITPAAAEAMETLTEWVGEGRNGGDFWVYDNERSARFPKAKRFVVTVTRWMAGQEGAADPHGMFTSTADELSPAIVELARKVEQLDGFAVPTAVAA